MAHLRIERALAANTLVAYGSDLSRFVDFTRDRGVTSCRAVQPADLREFLAQLGQSGASARSMARHLSSLRGYFRFLVEEGDISESPAELVTAPKLGRPLPSSAATHEMLRLLETPDISTLRGLRDRAMLSLTYAAGLRVSELVGLCVGDLNFESGTVTTEGKGGKRRMVPVGHLSLGHVEAYLARRSEHPKQAHSTALFCGPNGKALTRQAFWKIVRRHCLAAGIRTDLHPHSLRHSFASHLLAGGADLRSVQMLLGHSSIATTEIYTHLSAVHVQNAHQQSHPRG